MVKLIKIGKEELLKINQELEKTLDQHAIDDMALPSYTHRNPMIRWIFWKRLKKISKEIKENETILDFGSGFGVLLPTLDKYCSKVYFTDIKSEPSIKMVKQRKLEKCSFIEAENLLQLKKLNKIICADVLEHIEKLDELIAIFKQILNENGCLIVSYPTENFIYRIGRKIAGFTGEYHKLTYQEIEKIILKNGFKKIKNSNIPFLYSLFKIRIYKNL
jgi:2-polyprenyl-3-methyl-5-hydroxy-6-metoxy-1,4-benzoquinol methylase